MKHLVLRFSFTGAGPSAQRFSLRVLFQGAGGAFCAHGLTGVQVILPVTESAAVNGQVRDSV